MRNFPIKLHLVNEENKYEGFAKKNKLGINAVSESNFYVCLFLKWQIKSLMIFLYKKFIFSYTMFNLIVRIIFAVLIFIFNTLAFRVKNLEFKID